MFGKIAAMLGLAGLSASTVEKIGPQLGPKFGETGNPWMRKFGRRPYGRGRNTFVPFQGKQERARRVRQMVMGRIPFAQIGVKREDALAEYQQAVQNHIIRKAA